MALRKLIKVGFVAGTLAALMLLAVQPRPAWGIKILQDIRTPPRPMPEFANQDPQAWINSDPIHVADLRGKVVLIEVWTTS